MYVHLLSYLYSSSVYWKLYFFFITGDMHACSERSATDRTLSRHFKPLCRGYIAT